VRVVNAAKEIPGADGERDRPAAIAAAALLTAAAAASVNWVPILLGAAAAELSLSDFQIGVLAAADLGAACVVMVTGTVWVRRVSWRLSGLVGLVLLTVGNSLSAGADRLPPLLLARLIAGAGGGATYATALANLGSSRNPDRSFAFATSAQVTVGAAGLPCLPYLVRAWGMHGIYAVQALLSLAGLALLPLLPRGDVTATVEAHREGRPAPAAFVSLVATFLFYIAQGSFWSFVERIGHSASLSPDFIGSTLSISLALSLLGSLGASWLGVRYGRTLPLVATVVGQVFALVVLVGGISPGTFGLGVTVFNVLLSFGVTYLMGSVASRDPSGRLVVLIPVFQAAGLATGPPLASMFLGSGSYAPVNVVSGVCLVLSLALILPVELMGKSERQRA
jgi:predicted MFS family arabinose efflux permease